MITADPCTAVAAAAATALGSICAHCGYGGLQDVVARNGDYVVAGVCRQLRHLDAYPRQAWHLCLPAAAMPMTIITIIQAPQIVEHSHIHVKRLPSAVVPFNREARHATASRRHYHIWSCTLSKP